MRKPSRTHKPKLHSKIKREPFDVGMLWQLSTIKSSRSNVGWYRGNLCGCLHGFRLSDHWQILITHRYKPQPSMWGRGITVASHVLWHVDVLYTPGIANTGLRWETVNTFPSHSQVAVPPIQWPIPLESVSMLLMSFLTFKVPHVFSGKVWITVQSWCSNRSWFEFDGKVPCRRNARGSRDLNARPGVGEGGGPQGLKKIYYSNEKLVKWLSISLSVALQLFQCALHSLQTHFWLITNKFW